METMEAAPVEGETPKKSGLKSFIVGGIVTIAFLILPVAQIAMGSTYLHECTISPGIPVYLIGCGFVSLLMISLFAMTSICPAATDHKAWSVCFFGLILVYVIWLIYGSYAIYSVFPPNYREDISVRRRFNTHSISPVEPLNMTEDYMEKLNQSQNQTISYPFFNQTWMTNDTNHTVTTLTPSVSLRNSSGEMNREHLNVPQAHPVSYVVLYCDRSLYQFAFWTLTLLYVTMIILAIVNEAME